jgi:alkanesulfonate monooxygenase SsuD/methylene tetrahydromethanopterin reductase-like flavin-dependent oxidoreductase (luciferase family)
MIHNAILTVKSATTGEHRTFKISTVPPDANFAPGKRVLALLTGPDNTSNYTPFAFVNEFNIMVWAKKRGTIFQRYADVLLDLMNGGVRYAGRGFTMHEARCCRRCNRLLTTPESIAAGIGPECAKHEN